MQKHNMLPQSKIYVAGHRGLLGSAVIRNLKKRGFENIIFKTSSELNLTQQTQTFEFLEKEKPDFVFLCAAKVGGIKANMDAQADFLYQNLQIQNNVIEGSHRAQVKKLLFVGSSCIYPKDSQCPITEDALLKGPFEPTNEGYAIAKTTGIRMCQYFRDQYGCDFISAIPTNLYGINDSYDLHKSHLLPALILKIHTAKLNNHKQVDLWGSGKPRREFMLSDDCADALVHMMLHYSDRLALNVGTGIDLTVYEIAQTVAKALNADIEFKLDPSKPDGMMRKVLDITKLRSLGWSPQYELETGIQIAYKDFLQKFSK